MSNTLEHPCAVCRRQVAHGYLMCAPHWRLVPAERQQAVYRTWRRYNGVQGVGKAYVAKLRNEYETERTAAIATVRAALNPAPTPEGAPS